MTLVCIKIFMYYVLKEFNNDNAYISLPRLLGVRKE